MNAHEHTRRFGEPPEPDDNPFIVDLDVKVSDQFIEELTKLINKHSLENLSNTPDYMLAEYLRFCLNGINLLVNKREQWYGR